MRDIRPSLADYRKGAFYVIGEDGDEEHANATDLIYGGILNFCGCGDADASLVFVMRGLEIIDAATAPHPGQSSTDAYTEWKRRSMDHFGSEGASGFFFHWCDREGLSDHGGSIPGWLSEDGKRLLALLGEWASEGAAQAP